MVFVKSDESTTDDTTAVETIGSRTHSANICIAHLSDLHLFKPENMLARDFLTQRILGFLSWRLHRKMEHKIDFMPALLKVFEQTKVDHVVITGDITHLGHAADFKAAAAIFHELGGPDRVTLVPGNHDCYISLPSSDRYANLDAYLTPDADAPAAGRSLEKVPGPPSLRTFDGMAVIGISSARPSAPFLATGSIGRHQLDRLQKMLVTARTDNLFRLVLIHHPPVIGLVSRRKGLTDQAALAETIRHCGAELILHGHTHRFNESAIEGPEGMIPVIGVPSMTALTGKGNRRAGFHLNRIGPAEDGWVVQIETYRYSVSAAAFQSAGTRTLSIPRPTG